MTSGKQTLTSHIELDDKHLNQASLNSSHLPKSINVAFFFKTQSCPCSLLRQRASLEGFWHINIFRFNTALMFSTFYENWSEHTQIPNTKQLKKQSFSDNFLLWTGDATDTRERKNRRRNLSWSEVSPHRLMAQLIPSYALNLQMSERTPCVRRFDLPAQSLGLLLYDFGCCGQWKVSRERLPRFGQVAMTHEASRLVSPVELQ